MNVVPPISKSLIAALAGVLPNGGLVTASQDLARYSRDWSGDHFGRPLAVARPASVEEMSALMRHCHAQRIPVVPQGGLTGLVGAAVAADGGEIVISLERMNRIRSISPIDFAMVVEAGCILEVAKRAAEQSDCLLPITFGAQGSCRIGGNVATNAGGFNVLRYGMTRDLVLGLEVVLADGRIWNGLKVLRKDNRGYDLKQIFIGSEGTLGIVTAAALKLFPKPTQIETALVGLRSVEDAMALYARARRDCSDLLTAFELILRGGIEITMREGVDFPDPLSKAYPAYVLIEVSSGGLIDLSDMLTGFLGGVADIVEDGIVASTRAQAERLWLYREIMVERQGRGGRYLRTDVSVPISELADFVTDALAALEEVRPDALAVTYGHVGDGNIHLNVVPPEGMAPEAVEHLFEEAEAVIFAVVDRYGGSISAEHGIGRVKQKAFLERIDPVTLDLAAGIKEAFDPRHILSNGRILAANADHGL
ncbi:FAD-binding oxidoreductase [Mesorhizobium sp. B292B1B]|uniref:FAD-binding oxidoreductase n=1 Tax=unclassified Mesorhizobium TaxID=325217 RepID=UPI001128D0F1|nr:MULTISPECIES: FAD-binding oxidoreductase [unclassified Mesorhizobium]MBZ9966637.1 FAD-binding oxidoreductase [Mesorhizobium sp. BR1-1-2]MCA0014798.1 FAD-binding oxidoreductase [Mesorhizobium sp. B294B1A1]MCA0041081.1 FAD-binding oxidoreductase [Mesorhizobium sp. B292B1B]TPM42660.1 FAD-binding oxidoreductase [Mesorhizobium sp. B2-3-2]